jgi:hypothetical protein
MNLHLSQRQGRVMVVLLLLLTAFAVGRQIHNKTPWTNPPESLRRE